MRLIGRKAGGLNRIGKKRGTFFKGRGEGEGGVQGPAQTRFPAALRPEGGGAKVSKPEIAPPPQCAVSLFFCVRCPVCACLARDG